MVAVAAVVVAAVANVIFPAVVITRLRKQYDLAVLCYAPATGVFLPMGANTQKAHRLLFYHASVDRCTCRVSRDPIYWLWWIPRPFLEIKRANVAILVAKRVKIDMFEIL